MNLIYISKCYTMLTTALHYNRSERCRLHLFQIVAPLHYSIAPTYLPTPYNENSSFYWPHSLTQLKLCINWFYVDIELQINLIFIFIAN